MLFAGGTRWLLLIPADRLQATSQGVQMIGSTMQSASSLPEALVGAWRVAGNGPSPFMFALLNSISSPLNFGLGSAVGLARCRCTCCC